MNKKKFNVQMMVMTAMLAAIAGVLMSFEQPLPLMPPFYKLDFSDVPTVIAIFAYGPVSGALVEIIKLLIKLFTVGTNSFYVGEVANLIGIALFVIPVWLVYAKMGKTRKAAIVSLAINIPIRIAMSCAVNAFITLPMYAAAMDTTLQAIIDQVAKVNDSIKDLPTFLILATIPFNLIKNTLNCFLGFLLYDRLVKAQVLQRFSAGVKNRREKQTAK